MMIDTILFHKPNKSTFNICMWAYWHSKKSQVSSYRHGGSGYASAVSLFAETTAYPASPERKDPQASHMSRSERRQRVPHHTYLINSFLFFLVKFGFVQVRLRFKIHCSRISYMILKGSMI